MILAAAVAVATAAEPEESFRNPPDTARLWVYWTCQDGHYSIEGATADLEAMKKAGIGGVLRMDCSVGTPPPPGRATRQPDGQPKIRFPISQVRREGTTSYLPFRSYSCECSLCSLKFFW